MARPRCAVLMLAGLAAPIVRVEESFEGVSAGSFAAARGAAGSFAGKSNRMCLRTHLNQAAFRGLQSFAQMIAKNIRMIPLRII